VGQLLLDLEGHDGGLGCLAGHDNPSARAREPLERATARTSLQSRGRVRRVLRKSRIKRRIMIEKRTSALSCFDFGVGVPASAGCFRLKPGLQPQFLAVTEHQEQGWEQETRIRGPPFTSSCCYSSSSSESSSYSCSLFFHQPKIDATLKL